jgi:hypothetical protein
MWSAWLCWAVCALAAWGHRSWLASREAGAAAAPLVPTTID